MREAFVEINAAVYILEKVLTVNESAEGEERAGRPHLHPGGLLEGGGGGI